MGAVVGSTPFSVVLLESPKVANNGVATFQMKGTLWGVCGTSPGVPLADGGNVRATEAKAFDKMQGETLIIDMQGDQPAFENNVGAGSGVGNQIQTTTFPFDPNFNAFCGVGRQTPDSLITPTAIWLMRPSMMYQVVQQPIFYLFPGNIVPGTIVDFSTATAVSAKIDFTNSSTKTSAR
ncbi:hypothetical protein K469DRAFT_160008 [Zopfia rhizophila CBS 207.26]|uniref:Uncharacterized protein n=1 Tax=Zopfia rhizophila CBS 207.26 TaxID=1314779 RepID=A0A6A6E4I2_9PEZI|nr:hypothetical protein K469DRAFT_160008 [Zopfia rhizophila CBS 207.26]